MHYLPVLAHFLSDLFPIFPELLVRELLAALFVRFFVATVIVFGILFHFLLDLVEDVLVLSLDVLCLLLDFSKLHSLENVVCETDEVRIADQTPQLNEKELQVLSYLLGRVDFRLYLLHLLNVSQALLHELLGAFSVLDHAEVVYFDVTWHRLQARGNGVDLGSECLALLNLRKIGLVTELRQQVSSSLKYLALAVVEAVGCGAQALGHCEEADSGRPLRFFGMALTLLC